MTTDHLPTPASERRLPSLAVLPIALLCLLAPLANSWAEAEPFVPSSVGGSFELSWWKIAAGGGSSSGGDFTVAGTIGQHDVDPVHPASGGDLTLIGGFWVAFLGSGETLPDYLFRDRFEVEVD